jgi:hypothetical protein
MLRMAVQVAEIVQFRFIIQVVIIISSCQIFPFRLSLDYCL